MNRKERIISYINSKEYVPLMHEELKMVLGVPKEDEDEFDALMAELRREGAVTVSKRGRYMPRAEQTVAGTLSCNVKGYFGFVITPDAEDDIFIAGDDMNGAIDGDAVLAEITGTARDGRHSEGRVLSVLSRGNETVAGVLYKEKNGCLCLRPDSRKIYTKIIIAPENALDAQIGDRVITGELQYKTNGDIYGSVTDILGGEDELKSITEGIIIENGIKREFDEKTLIEADKTPQSVVKAQLEGREDLRERLIFTIDGDDARDFDDAVSLDILENGNYALGVHIADVTEYVKEGSALDNEAFERGTSVYLPDRVIPMLPESLSNGICSLNPKVDRLTLSCFMEIDKSGGIINNRLAKTVIRSKERMTYNNVNKILSGDSELCEKYAHLTETLTEMARLAEILREKRTKRGAIDFDFPECRVVVDENGEPTDIVRAERGVSNRMIEEFMLAANETVAEFAYWSEIPFVYRSHEPPSFDKIKAFNALITHFGLTIKGKIDEDNPIKPKALQKVLSEAEGTAGERIIASEMLRSLMKAKYTPENLGHFGLAAKYYCHFTSPIRRYPDLCIHRILKLMLDGKLKNTGRLTAFTAEASLRSSDREVAAEMAERDADDLMKAAYMARFVGEEFEAVIANITGFGMFVELDNTVQGLVRLDTMKDDYYEYSENSGAVTGQRTGTVYNVGDTINVTLVKSDIMTRQIDFVRAEDFDGYEEKTKRPNRATRRRKQSKHKNYRGKKKRNGKF